MNEKEFDTETNLQDWQIAHIQKGIEDAKAGRFVPDEEIKAMFAKIKKLGGKDR